MDSAAMRADVQAFLQLLKTTPLANLEAMTPVQARALMQQLRAAGPPVQHQLAVVRDLSFEQGQHTIGLRFYDAVETRPPGPLLVYFHGGGFVIGDLETHHALCASIAAVTNLPVVSVAYRLAPEHPWPAAPDDAEAAARWVAAAAREQLGREVTALVLAGDSAGANLAAVTARALRDRPARIPVLAQYLIYPCTAAHRDTGSRREFAEGLFLTRRGIDWFFTHYAAKDGDPRIDLAAFDQAGMPPTVLVTAGLDPLRDEGRAYAAALIQAGVPVTYQEAMGNIHGSFSMCAAIPSTLRDLDKSLHALCLLIADGAADGRGPTLPA